MLSHSCVPPFLPVGLSQTAERNTKVRASKLLAIWGFLLSASRPVGVTEMLILGESLNLTSPQSVYLYLRAMTEMGVVRAYPATEGTHRKLYSGVFPPTLTELDRQMLAHWIDSAVCESCVGQVRARFLGNCPIEQADHRHLPLLPAGTRETIRRIDRLHEPKVRQIWGELISSEDSFSLAQVLRICADTEEVLSSQTIGHYVRAMRGVGLIQVAKYARGIGKIYQGRFPPHTGRADIAALALWLRSLPLERARVVRYRAAAHVNLPSLRSVEAMTAGDVGSHGGQEAKV
ncbi:hypothetical protein [Streptomyces iranensis]|uniref:hypothetical protein n=1 Tax=Streptomyces iranensis TaxID=576784 RepID=UPI0039B77398